LSQERNGLGNFTRFQEEKQQYGMYLHVSTNIKEKMEHSGPTAPNDKMLSSKHGYIRNYDKGVSFRKS
jgi:hypothetical protein